MNYLDDMKKAVSKLHDIKLDLLMNNHDKESQVIQQAIDNLVKIYKATN